METSVSEIEYVHYLNKGCRVNKDRKQNGKQSSSDKIEKKNKKKNISRLIRIYIVCKKFFFWSVVERVKAVGIVSVDNYWTVVKAAYRVF